MPWLHIASFQFRNMSNGSITCGVPQIDCGDLLLYCGGETAQQMRTRTHAAAHIGHCAITNTRRIDYVRRQSCCGAHLAARAIGACRHGIAKHRAHVNKNPRYHHRIMWRLVGAVHFCCCAGNKYGPGQDRLPRKQVQYALMHALAVRRRGRRLHLARIHTPQVCELAGVAPALRHTTAHACLIKDATCVVLHEVRAVTTSGFPRLEPRIVFVGTGVHRITRLLKDVPQLL